MGCQQQELTRDLDVSFIPSRNIKIMSPIGISLVSKMSPQRLTLTWVLGLAMMPFWMPFLDFFFGVGDFLHFDPILSNYLNIIN